jgi:hypothetical protein
LDKIKTPLKIVEEVLAKSHIFNKNRAMKVGG